MFILLIYSLKEPKTTSLDINEIFQVCSKAFLLSTKDKVTTNDKVTVTAFVTRSFPFADTFRYVHLDVSAVSTCSFDRSSLFTNAPVPETIEICANELCVAVPLHLFHVSYT